MAITATFNADKHLNEKLSAVLGASISAKCIVEKDMTITHVSFYNQSTGTTFTSAASVVNGALTVVSSTSTLGTNTAEEKESTDLSNTTVSDGATITLTAGDQATYIVVTFESLQE